MNLHALDIPDAPAQLAPWLERQLTGLHLGELVAELSAVHGVRAGAGRSLAEIAGFDLGRVLESGLSTLPHSVLRELLRNPESLLELQESVLIEGGRYWDRIDESSETLQAHVARGWQQVSRVLNETVPVVRPATSRPGDSGPAAANAPSRPGNRSRAGMILTAAAALLLGFFLGDRFGPRPPQVASGWGWQKPGALEAAGSQREYLNHLADAAEDWFKKRPETPAALAKRISEFRDGCTMLLLAEHKPLTAETKAWLRERCSVWAGKLDGHRNGLEAGQDVLTVRGAADETVKKLIQAIRTKATEVS